MKTKTKKLNFAEMGKTLTRAEMKQIMAGSGTNCWICSFYPYEICKPSDGTMPPEGCTWGDCGGSC